MIDGELFEKIQVDELVWTVESSSDTKTLDINLVKWPKAMQWWDCICMGDIKIDAQKINPEPSNIGDLDDDLKPTVSKMMFDMQQKKKGLPSSDELKKKDMLGDFMKSHPEMDFSKCKFN